MNVLDVGKENFGDGPTATSPVGCVNNGTGPVCAADADTPVARKRPLGDRTPGKDITGLVINTTPSANVTPSNNGGRVRCQARPSPATAVDDEIVLGARYAQGVVVFQDALEVQPRTEANKKQSEDTNEEDEEVFFGKVSSREVSISEKIGSSRRKTLVLCPSPGSAISAVSIATSAGTGVSDYIDANASFSEDAQCSAAVMIQGWVRSRFAVRKMNAMKQSAVVLQAHFRACLARKQYARALKSVVLMQACGRRVLAIKQYRIKLQAHYAEQQRLEEMRRESAAIRLQSLFRMCLASKACKKRLACIIKIQSFARQCKAKTVVAQKKAEAAKAEEMTKRMKSLYDEWQQKIAARKSSIVSTKTTNASTTEADSAPSKEVTSTSTSVTKVVEIDTLPTAPAVSSLEQKKQRLARIRAERLRLQSKTRDKNAATDSAKSTVTSSTADSAKPFTKPQKVPKKTTPSVSRQNDAACQQNTIHNARTSVQIWGRQKTGQENQAALRGIGFDVSSPRRAGNVVAVIANHKPYTDYTLVAAQRPVTTKRNVRWRDLGPAGDPIWIESSRVASPSMPPQPGASRIRRRADNELFEYANEQASPVFITTKSYGRITQHLIQTRSFYPEEL